MARLRRLRELRQRRELLLAAGPPMAGGAAQVPVGALGWLALLWPFPAVVGSTFLIAWASEVAAFFISRGMALAVLALLQVLPEFAVEAVLARNAALDPTQLQFVTANFTGANRILVGLLLPLIFFITLRVRKKRGEWQGALTLENVNSVEVVFLLLPSLYSLSYWFRHEINVIDTVLLTAMYAAYLLVLYRLPVAGEEEVEELHGVPARVMKRSRRFQGGFAAGAFMTGGFILFLTVEPFVHNMQIMAFALGISAYLVVQYVAPLLSEFPEFLSTTYFARHNKGEDAFSNVVSAKINQWTVLIGMIPLVFVITLLSVGQPLVGEPSWGFYLIVLAGLLLLLSGTARKVVDMGAMRVSIVAGTLVVVLGISMLSIIPWWAVADGSGVAYLPLIDYLRSNAMFDVVVILAGAVILAVLGLRYRIAAVAAGLFILLAPILFVTTLKLGSSPALPLDAHQNVEVLLTSAQGLFAVACLLKLRFLLWEAVALFGLWVFQAVDFLWDPLLVGRVPSILGSNAIVREYVTVAFFALIAVQFALYGRQWTAFRTFAAVWRTYIRPPPPPPRSA